MEVKITELRRVKETSRCYINCADGTQYEFDDESVLQTWLTENHTEEHAQTVAIALRTAQKTSPDLSDIRSIAGKQVSVDPSLVIDGVKTVEAVRTK